MALRAPIQCVSAPEPLPPACPEPMSSSAYGDTVMLVDWENLKWSLSNTFNAVPHIPALLAAVQEHGRLIVGRAYADWTKYNLRADAPLLYRAGIEPIYVPSQHPTHDTALKNSADIRLAVDAVDLCWRFPHATTFLLVTGDGDLVHALSFLRLHGRRVIVLGVGNTMSALLSSADAVLLYERDVEHVTTPQSSSLLAEPVDSDVPSMDAVVGWITTIVRESGSAAPYPFAQLGHYLKLRYGFDPRTQCGASLKDLLLRMQAAGHVQLSSSGGMDYVTLLDSSAPKLTRGSASVHSAITSRQPEETKFTNVSLQR